MGNKKRTLNAGPFSRMAKSAIIITYVVLFGYWMIYIWTNKTSNPISLRFRTNDIKPLLKRIFENNADLQELINDEMRNTSEWKQFMNNNDNTINTPSGSSTFVQEGNGHNTSSESDTVIDDNGENDNSRGDETTSNDRKEDTTTNKPESRDNSETEAGCSIFSPWNKNLLDPQTSTELTTWTFTKTIKCLNFTVDKNPPKRKKAVLDCTSSPPTLKYTWTNSSRDLFSVPFGDTCLESVIDNCCTDKMAVPNVLHYIWYKEVEFGYFHFLSYMSALRFMKPCLYLIHGNYVPYGKYWDYFVSISPNVIHVKRDRLLQVHGNTLSFPEHSADVMRIEAIQKYGGLYLDWDQILLRDINTLRQHNCTMGQVYHNSFGNQVIFGRKNATFLKLWHDSYKNYRTGHWGHNSLFKPFQLAMDNPGLIHIEGYNFTRPREPVKIFHRNYDWSTNYAMHLYIRFYKTPINLDIFRKLNSTIGSVSRHIIFGNKEMCVE